MKENICEIAIYRCPICTKIHAVKKKTKLNLNVSIEIMCLNDSYLLGV